MIKLLIGIAAIVIPILFILLVGRIADHVGFPVPNPDPDDKVDQFVNGCSTLIILGLLFAAGIALYHLGGWIISEIKF